MNRFHIAPSQARTKLMAAGRVLASALLAGVVVAAPASAQSASRGVYETPPIQPLQQRPRGNDQYIFQSPGYGEQGYGQGNGLGQGPGYGRDQRQGYGRPWSFDERRAYSGQPGFGYHQPLGYSPHGGRGVYPGEPGHLPRPGYGGRPPFPVK